MTREEAKIYFKQCNSRIISVCKDENEYDYEKQEIISNCARRTYEANRLAIQALEQESYEDKGEISDGYHTFNQLYHQRAILFACIVKQNKNKAWKSFKHSDGKYCFDSDGEWFIVGVDTPQGSYTYHYAKEYWDMFDCQELECGKEWDGHTEEDVTRLLSLEQGSRWIPCGDNLPEENGVYLACYEDATVLLDWFNGKWFIHGKNPAVEAGTVIAWQPLPKPYKSHESEEV